NQAYALAVQEESQHILSVVNSDNEPLTMLAGRGQGFKAARKPGLKCDYCGYKGHLKENCYKIIGYPPDFKSKRKPQNSSVKGYANVSAGEGGSSNITTQTHGHYFTEDQYKQLLGLLNKPDPNPGDCYTLMAGITSSFSKAFNYDWIIDTGASHHVTPYKEVLKNIQKIENQ
ncbi:hypothetical protein A4A49_62677, partial [Nicotiana attenuata]